MGQQYKFAREYGGRIAQATTQFEQEVAQKAPEYAIQQYKEQAIQEANARIAPRVQQLKESIASKQARVEEIEKEGGSLRDTRKERYAVAELQAELNVLESGLQGDPNELIKGYYSGNLQAKAKFERQKEEAKNERRLSPKTETIEYQPVKGVYTASGKFYPTTAKGWLPQTAQEGMVPGEKVIYTTSKEGVTTPTSIKSEFFKETIPIGEYNKKIEEYNKALEMPQVSKGALPEYILKDVPTGGTVIREGYGTDRKSVV